MPNWRDIFQQILSIAIKFFVRDGIISVADYNSTRVGGVVVVIVVVVVVVVWLFCNGITWERFELSSWNFAWWLVMTLCFESQFGFQFHSRRPAQPANQPKVKKWANSANFYPIEFKLGTEVINNLPDGNWMFFEWLRPSFDLPARPTKIDPKLKIFNFRVFHLIWRKFGMGAKNGAKTT